jgi:hypothetical protein
MLDVAEILAETSSACQATEKGTGDFFGVTHRTHKVPEKAWKRPGDEWEKTKKSPAPFF